MITLRPVTRDNWPLIYRLKVAPDQQDFVASNAYSLLEAAYAPPDADVRKVPLGIYLDETPIGFAMYNVSPDQEHFFIMRLMVDAEHQRKGHGRAAMEQLLDRFRESPSIKEVGISYMPDNTASQYLYASLGFQTVGMEDGEIVAVLTLAPLDGSWTSRWPQPLG